MVFPSLALVTFGVVVVSTRPTVLLPDRSAADSAVEAAVASNVIPACAGLMVSLDPVT